MGYGLVWTEIVWTRNPTAEWKILRKSGLKYSATVGTVCLRFEDPRV